MKQRINDYLQHFWASDLGTEMFRVIDAMQHIEDNRKRVAAQLMVTLLILDTTVGIEAGLSAGLNALKDLKTAEEDTFKAIRDYIAQEIVK